MPEIDLEKCVRCGICRTFCPEGVVYQDDDKYVIDYNYCKGCGICANECPKSAISMVLEVK